MKLDAIVESPTGIVLGAVLDGQTVLLKQEDQHVRVDERFTLQAMEKLGAKLPPDLEAIVRPKAPGPKA